MKVGPGADHRWPRLESQTTLNLDGLEFIEIPEVPIGQGFIRQGLQSFSRLQLRRIRRQKDQMQAHRDLHLRTHMPARAVDDEEDLFVSSRAYSLGELRQGKIKGYD
jgi:hypothetical protein